MKDQNHLTEQHYAKVLRLLIGCMNVYGHQAAAKTVLEFARRKRRVESLSRALEL